MSIFGNSVGGLLPTPQQIGAAATNRIITSANTTTYSGMYRIQQADDVPTDCRYGQLLVMCHSETDTIAQIAMAHTGSKAYIRNGAGMSNGVVGTWTDWAQIYSTANKPTAEEVGAVDNTINRGDWKIAGTGVSYWRYEGADTAALDLPTQSCFIVVMKDSAARGTAIAYDWLSDHYNIWRNTLHDDSQNNNWSGWKSAVESIGAIPSDPSVRTQIPAGSDIKAFFSNGYLPLGYYYYYPETAPVNAPIDNNDWWFFNRTPAGIYAQCSSQPNRKWIGTDMNGTFHGWAEIYTSENLSPEVVGAVPTTRKVNGKYLSSDITLGASDVGARPNTWMPTPAEIRAAVGVGSLGGADANTVTTSGMYRLQTEANIPSGAHYGQLIVVHGAGDTIAQVAFDFSGSKMWVRTGNPSDVGGGGTWGSWKRVITADSFRYSNGTLTITI